MKTRQFLSRYVLILSCTGPANMPGADIASIPATSTDSALRVALATLMALSSALLAAPLTPIARWDVVPYQRVEQSEGLKCGVIAFSKAGIAKVTFHVNDQLRHVASMRLNDRTGVYEYWTPVAASDFVEDGPVQIGATVDGNDGGKRALPPLVLVSNPNGSLPRREAWVDADDGDDGAGVTGNPQRPFATIGRAMDGIRLWMKAQGHGDRADGGIVRLRPGNHAMSNGRIWREIRTVDEWVTVTRDADATRATTIIDRFAGALQTRLLKVEGVTLRSTGKHAYVIRGTQKYSGMNLWVDDCVIRGAGRHIPGSHPIHHGNFIIWTTDSHFTDLPSAIGGHRLARGLTIKHIGDDVSRHCPLLVNCVADNVDPGATYAHSDTWQSWFPDEPNNTLAYNVRVTDAHYQGIMSRTGKTDAPVAKGVAFVNCLIELRPPIRAPHRGARVGSPVSLWMRPVDHFLMWHCSLLGQSLNFYADKAGRARVPLTMTNVSVVGCCFGNMKKHTHGGQVDLSGFESNHTVRPEGIHSVTPGSDVPTGDPMLTAEGTPRRRSPLVNRLTRRLVPADAAGIPRDSRPDIGAYELPLPRLRPQ